MAVALRAAVLDPVTADAYQAVGFAPHREQVPILACAKGDVLVSGGGQSGKSLTASKWWLKQWIRDLGEKEGKGDGEGPPLRYWLVAVDYGRTRAEFDYIVGDLMKLGYPVRVTKRVDPGEIILRLPGEKQARLVIETKSAKDPKALAMYSPDGIIGCEASQLDLETYWKFQERVAASGGWIFMSGTLEGSLGWYPSTYMARLAAPGKNEAAFSMPTPSNIHLFPGGVNDPKILKLKAGTSDDYFMERIMGQPVPPTGLVFKEFRPEVHIRPVEYVPGETVYVWNDPGYNHANAVEAAQIINGQVRVFWEGYEKGFTTEDMISVVMQQPWWGEKDKKGAIDVAGTQHQAMSAPAEVWLAKAGLFMASQKVPINDGIERMKSFLKINQATGAPGIVFNPRCKGILSEFGAYPDPFDGQTRAYRWKMDKDGGIVGETPEDRWCDGVKACWYGLVDKFGYVTSEGNQLFTMKRHGFDEKKRLTHFRPLRRYPVTGGWPR